MNTWQFGDVRVDRVLEFEQPLLGWQQLLPAATSEAVDRQRAYLEPRWMEPGTGKLVMSFHSFLIRSHGLKILVDTCGGNDKPRPNKPRYHMQRWPYLDRLAVAGVSPEEIDFVLCTHLHVDHVGWNTRLVGGRWVPTFPKARYVFARREWDYWREHYKTEAFKDDPFYIDLGATFDTLNFRAGAVPGGFPPAVLSDAQDARDDKNFAADDVSGFNVNTIAIELPIGMLTADGQIHGAGDAKAVIGTYATTSRPRVKVLSPKPGRICPTWIRYCK